MNPQLSLQKHLHNGPSPVPGTEPEEGGHGLWSGTAESSADAQHLPPCLALLFPNSSSARGLQGAEHKMSACIPPSSGNPSHTPKPFRAAVGGCWALQHPRFQTSWVHAGDLLPHWPHQNCSSPTHREVLFVLGKLHCQSIFLDLDLRLRLL